MALRRKILIIACLACIFCALSFSMPSALAETERARIELSFDGYAAVYHDEILAAPDFTALTEFNDRRVNAPHAKKLDCVEQNLSKGASPKAAILYSYPRLEPVVTDFLERSNRRAVDATISFKPYASPMFTVTRERVGYRVDEQRLYYDIYLALRSSPNAQVIARAETILPAVTARDLAACTRLRATAKTDYSHSSENRKHNIRLALAKINGKCLNVGEEFSFNSTVGKRTAANGFAEAKIIVDGEYTEGTGGGVCQASTTVYNAALLADLKITAVRNHSLPPSYVPPSFDAMVNGSGSDLKFVNSTSGPVFIRAYTTETSAVVEIYGLPPTCRVVKESRVISRSAVPNDKQILDTENKYVTEEMASGETKRVSYGAAGLTSEGYLLYYDNSGALVERKLIRKDVYRSVQGVVAVKP